MFLDNLSENVRTIHRNIRSGLLNVYFLRRITGSMNFEPVRRIIDARVRKGVLQVRAINTGLWMDVDINADHIYFQ